MLDFIYYTPTKILFGKDQLKNLSKEIKKYGSRVLICYGGGSIKKIGLYDEVVKILKEDGIFYKELSGIKPNPRIDSVREGVKIVKENNLDFILAVGGGSTIDCAKLIAAGADIEEDPWKIVIREVKIKNPLPIGSILTLSATGSEMNGNSVITNLDKNQKFGWSSEKVMPKFSILNPEYTYSVSKYQTASGTADIISHTLEEYFSNVKGAFLQDNFAESILRTCLKYGKVAIEEPNNYEARANLMWAGSWAINGILSDGAEQSWSVHPMEHELSAFYDVTHGVGLAILTPRYLEYILNEDTAIKIAQMGVNVFGIEKTDNTVEDAKKSIKALYNFFKSLNIPMTLSELGIKEEDLSKMAKTCIENKKGAIKGFVTLKEEDVFEIYKMSF